ncbi:glycosyltransferase family 39 protein [Beggiatoa alba]|nr:glycosyltransferase family 39 protein [Beggiatoa alba]
MKFLPAKFKNLQPVEWLNITIIVSLFIRLVLAYWIPLTGDEAYFISWGKNLDYGYYDHPPMVGWFLSFMLLFGDATLWLRLPGILMFTFMGIVIYRLLKGVEQDNERQIKAAFAAILFLIAPLNLLSVLITTDTPLILWSFISAFYFYKAQYRDQTSKYLLAGFFLGLAFYSKFFAGLLGLAYLFYVLIFIRNQRGLKPYTGILIILLAASPFIILNLIWNYNNCWNNYLFNFLNRTTDAHFSWTTIGIYLGLLLYLITPPLLWYAFKHSKVSYLKLVRQPLGIYLGLFVLPLLLFLLLAFFKKIGLHWLLSFYPFLFISIGLLFKTEQLLKSIQFMLIFSALHLGAVIFILGSAPGLFEKNINTYKDVIYGFENDVILEKLAPYRDDYMIATDSYIESALLSYTSREHVIVLGHGSYHAREDDKRTDFRKLEGKNILLVSYSKNLDYLRGFFETVEIKPLRIEKATFYYALGRNFKYKEYRKNIIQHTLDNYYRIPEWLPTGQCYMDAMYKR